MVDESQRSIGRTVEAEYLDRREFGSGIIGVRVQDQDGREHIVVGTSWNDDICWMALHLLDASWGDIEKYRKSYKECCEAVLGPLSKLGGPIGELAASAGEDEFMRRYGQKILRSARLEDFVILTPWPTDQASSLYDSNLYKSAATDFPPSLN